MMMMMMGQGNISRELADHLLAQKCCEGPKEGAVGVVEVPRKYSLTYGTCPGTIIAIFHFSQFAHSRLVDVVLIAILALMGLFFCSGTSVMNAIGGPVDSGLVSP
jgi:hypothetical protein